MIILVISILLIMVCFILKRSDFFGGLLLVWLWILFGWSYGNADYANYLYKYSHIDSLGNNFEILDVGVTKLSNLVGLDYKHFLILFSAIFIIAIFYFTKKNTENWCFVIALYTISPFMLDVVQIRNSMALIFIWLGLDALINYKRKIDLVRFVSCVIVASMFHSASIIFLLILFPFFLERHDVIVVTSIIITVGILATRFLGNILFHISTFLNMSERYSMYAYQGVEINARKVLIIITLFITFEIGILIIRNSQELSRNADLNFTNFVEKMNIIMLVVIPITSILPDAYRMMESLMLVNFILLGRAMDTMHSKYVLSINEGRLRLCGAVTAMLNITILVFSSVNINTVFYPLIYHNLLF